MDKEKLIEKILDKTNNVASLDKILNKKQRTDRDFLQFVKDVLYTLIKDKKIYKLNYANAFLYVNADSPLVRKGKIVTTKGAYAFIRPDGEVTSEHDRYIDAIHLNNAVFGDTVLFIEYLECIVLDVLEHSNFKIIGTVRYNQLKKRLVLQSDNNKISETFVLRNEDSSICKDGDKIECKIIDYKNLIVEKVRYLGQNGDRDADVLSILVQNDFSDVFPEEAIKEAKSVASLPITSSNRKDFRNLVTVTIDGDSTKDFDDAISLLKNGEKYELYVHIADVAEYVKQAGEIDKVAFKRATSVYFPEHVFPMLPTELSNGVCSINPNEDRYALTAKMIIDNKGKVVDGEIYESIIQSDYRMTYNEVENILNNDEDTIKKYSDIKDLILNMYDLSNRIQERLDKAGAVHFITKDCNFKIEDRKIIDVVEGRELRSNKIIESFMVTANSFVSKYMTKKKAPFVYRVHDAPDLDALYRGIEFASSFNLNIDFDNFQDTFNKEILKVVDPSIQQVISYTFLRAMSKARYETKNNGHYGLGLKYYSHFTSPIRRYADLTIHRVIKAYLRKGQFEEKDIKYFQKLCNEGALQSTQRELAALQSERDVNDLYKCIFMKDKKGKTYQGTIVSVTKFGLFIDFYHGIEGLLRFEEMPDDYYLIENNALVGNRFSFQLGDKIDVSILDVDISQRRISLASILAKKYGKKGATQRRW